MNSPDKNNNNFFDTRTIVAIVLVGVCFFGWQKYLEKKYPDFYKNRAANQQQTAAPAKNSGANSGVKSSPEAGISPASPAEEVSTPTQPEELLTMQVGDLSFAVSSVGMGLKNITLLNYKDREMNPIHIGGSKRSGLYELGLVGSADKINFHLQKISDLSVKGTAQVGSMQIEQTLNFDEKNNSFNSQVHILHADAKFAGLSVTMSEAKQASGGGTLFLPSIEHQEFVVRHQDSLDRVNALSKKEDVTKDFSQVSMMALSSQYFGSALLDKSNTIPEIKIVAPVNADPYSVLSYKPSTVSEQIDLQWLGYVGPKSLSQLQSVDPGLADVVNYGFFSPIGKVVLSILKSLYAVVGNWGVAIILVTLLMRLLVLPFNIVSYKSMKKMQTIQPMLASLRERYKNDPKTLNTETMNLMRTQKVNPVGGCLPMLLQMPVFFALYQVLGQSIELYQAPFFLWIHDLSMKDPYYVLPILMGVTMFFQQKATPTTMDPQQAKIMKWMPIIFSIFTVSLPAGLTLYIFVSTLFAFTQQQLFMRDRKNRIGMTAAVSTK